MKLCDALPQRHGAGRGGPGCAEEERRAELSKQRVRVAGRRQQARIPTTEVGHVSLEVLAEWW